MIIFNVKNYFFFRQLRDGSLQQNSIYHGSTLTLLPSVETGLLSQRPEQGVMQALESLNDSQVCNLTLIT